MRSDVSRLFSSGGVVSTLTCEESSTESQLPDTEMSVALEEGTKSNSKGKCARWIWRMFPHVFLILSLILFAAFGALIFERIEKKESSDESEKMRWVVREVLETVQNHTGMTLRL